MAQREDQNNPLLAFGRWIAERPRNWPAEAVESARRQFIDTLAVSVAGSAEAVSRKLLRAVSTWGNGHCTVIGTTLGAAAPWAALANGTAAHALDFDDNFDPAKAHASAVLVPAILAVAEEAHLGGEAVIDSYIAGLQILGRVGQGLNPVHRNRGWHATATVGAVGAAAACSRLQRVDALTAAHAMSIATSMAGGFMAQFGTMAKPLHAGLAAKAGVMAARLAREGIDASLEALDGPTGMQQLMVGPDYAELRDTLEHVEHGQTLRFETRNVGDPLLILEHGFRVKRYPNCGSAHRAIDGLLDLKRQHGFSVEDVVEIHVHAPVTHLANLMHQAPATVAEARFSLEYGLATALLYGNCRLSDFTDNAVKRPEVRALYGRIFRHPVDLPESAFPTRVVVKRTDGRVHEIEVAMPKGSIAAPFPLEMYHQKFEDCTSGFMSPDGVRQLQDALKALPALNEISELMDPLRFENRSNSS